MPWDDAVTIGFAANPSRTIASTALVASMAAYERHWL